MPKLLHVTLRVALLHLTGFWHVVSPYDDALASTPASTEDPVDLEQPLLERARRVCFYPSHVPPKNPSCAYYDKASHSGDAAVAALGPLYGKVREHVHGATTVQGARPHCWKFNWPEDVLSKHFGHAIFRVLSLTSSVQWLAVVAWTAAPGLSAVTVQETAR